MPDYMPKSAQPYMPKSARPYTEVGAGETFVNRAVNMLPGGRPVTDALTTMAMQGARAAGGAFPNAARALSGVPVLGALAPVAGAGAELTPQAQAELDAMGVERPAEEASPGWVDAYRDARDTRAERTAAGSKQNPWAGRAGALTGFGLSLAAPGPKGGPGLKGSVATGAGYGALAGLTEGSADLTRGEFGQALKDTAQGAVLGGGFGAAGHGLMALGKKGVQALRGARQDTLAQETLAAREAAEAAQAQAAKAAEADRKLVGGAREMNKAFDNKRAKELLKQARGGGARVPAGSVEDPGTNALVGMSRKARQAQQSRSKEVERFQQQMNDPDLPTNVSADRQKYIDEMPKAAERGPNADPAGLRRDFVEQYLHQRYPNDPERVARIMRERVGPGGEVLSRPLPAVGDDAALAAGEAPMPSLADEAEAAMAARRGEPPRLTAGQPQEQLPMLPELERVPTRAAAGPARVRTSPALTARPTRRGDSPAFDVGGRPPQGFEQARTRPGGGAAPQQPPLPENSMAAPVDMPLPPEAATRATRVPDLRRPIPLPPPTGGTQTARLGPEVAPAAPPPPMADDIQDVTRLAGPEDVGPLAAERAAGREAGAFGAVARAGYEGVRSGNGVLSSMAGGLAGIRRESLKDPAVKARALAAAKVQLLSQINPEVFSRVGGQLANAAAGGEGQYRAVRYVQARRDPDFREAEAKAAEQASRMSDDQLMQLIAGGAP